MTLPYFNPERSAAFREANWAGRQAIHKHVAQRKADAMAERRALGQDYLRKHPPEYEISRDKGVARLQLVEQTRAAREEAAALSEGRDAQANNRALEFPVLGRDFPADSAISRLATSPLLVAPIVRYFDMLPVLFNMFVTRAHTTEILENSAHRFHIDPEDVITHKVFIHMTDVDDDSGPLHVLPADQTQKVLAAVDYRGIDRVSDQRVKDIAHWAEVVKCDGPAGSVELADTSRCLHFGGRPRVAGKPVRMTLLFQYLLPTSYLFPLDGDAEPPRHLPNLQPNGDECWDALIGAQLT